MSLLENELVKKYFGCEQCDPHYHDMPGGCPFMAVSLIRAMEEPIKTGELALNHEMGQISVWTYRGDMKLDGLHTTLMRLPDRFQPQPEKVECQCGMNCATCHMQRPEPARDEVQQKIEEIIGLPGNFSISLSREYLDKKLRDLVALARRSEQQGFKRGKA